MLAFTEIVDRWYAQMLKVPRPRLVALIRLGEKIVSFLADGKADAAGRVTGACHGVSERSRRTLGAGAIPFQLLDDQRFRALLSDEDWGRLPLAIWRRFSKRLADGKTVVYVGEVEEASHQPRRAGGRASSRA